MSQCGRVLGRIWGGSEEMCNVASEGNTPLTTEGSDSGRKDFKVVRWKLLRHAW